MQPNTTQLETLVTMLKVNLGLNTDYMDADDKQAKELELAQYIKSSVDYIEREGIILNYDIVSDNMLVVLYSNFLYDRRKDGVALFPRALRYNLNTRLLSQKVKE